MQDINCYKCKVFVADLTQRSKQKGNVRFLRNIFSLSIAIFQYSPWVIYREGRVPHDNIILRHNDAYNNTY